MDLLEVVSGLADRHLKKQVPALRDAYMSVRSKLYPVLRLMYGSFDAATLRAHLETRIGNDFEILMVHSSVNHLVPMFSEGPLDFVKMLMAWCGPQRTLVMPAFYFGDPEIGGVKPTFSKNPRFDLRRTPSQMGLATELFRRIPGVLQSRHPVYRVSALGPLARALTLGHELAEDPAGLGTPFEVMAKHNALIIGVGKTFQVLTQVHHVEGVMGNEFPVPRGNDPGITVTVIDGAEQIPVTLTGRGLLGDFDIWKLRDIMDESSLQAWTFHHVPMFATRAGDLTSRLLEAARQGVTLYRKS
jgi:aminoglycoside N3'-acetyltransferase